MPSVKMSNFIVLDKETNMRDLKTDKSLYKYADQGLILYIVGSIVPVIIKGKNCVGLAEIVSLTMKKETTTVYFTFTPAYDDKHAKALYSLYQSNVGSYMDSSDPYDANADILIPGAMGINPKLDFTRNSGNDSGKGRRNVNSSILSDFDDDDDDEY